MMQKRKAFLRLTIFVVFLLILSGSAHCFSINLNTPNEAMPIMNYATVQGIVDSTDASIFHFEVDLALGLESSLHGGNNFGMDTFYFNSVFDDSELEFMNWDPVAWNISNNRNGAGFGRFDFRLADPGDRADHLYFDIRHTGGATVTEEDFFILSNRNAGNGNGHFAAHIGGFDFDYLGQNFDSIQVRDGNSSVPEPSTLILLGSGLIGLGAFRRKFNK